MSVHMNTEDKPPQEAKVTQAQVRRFIRQRRKASRVRFVATPEPRQARRNNPKDVNA